MSEAAIVAIIVAVLNGIPAMIAAFMLYRVKQNVQLIETATNSMMARRDVITRDLGLAEGNIQGRQDQRAEDAKESA